MAEDLKISDVETDVLTWLERVVIGLNLCPFARKPYEDERIRIVTELANDYDSILERLLAELSYLQDDNQQKVETTLVVVPNTLEDFNEYLACLADVNQLLISQGYEGALQVASFHPNYQFAGTRASVDFRNFPGRSTDEHHPSLNTEYCLANSTRSSISVSGSILPNRYVAFRVL